MRFIKPLAALSLSFLLAACGGGGDGATGLALDTLVINGGTHAGTYSANHALTQVASAGGFTVVSLQGTKSGGSGNFSVDVNFNDTTKAVNLVFVSITSGASPNYYGCNDDAAYSAKCSALASAIVVDTTARTIRITGLALAGTDRNQTAPTAAAPLNLDSAFRY